MAIVTPLLLKLSAGKDRNKEGTGSFMKGLDNYFLHTVKRESLILAPCEVLLSEIHVVQCTCTPIVELKYGFPMNRRFRQLNTLAYDRIEDLLFEVIPEEVKDFRTYFHPQIHDGRQDAKQFYP